MIESEWIRLFEKWKNLKLFFDIWYLYYVVLPLTFEGSRTEFKTPKFTFQSRFHPETHKCLINFFQCKFLTKNYRILVNKNSHFWIEMKIFRNSDRKKIFFLILHDDLYMLKNSKNHQHSENIKTGLKTGNFCNENDQKLQISKSCRVKDHNI